jgi:hypothetical protein
MTDEDKRPIDYNPEYYAKEKYYFDNLKAARDALQAQYHPSLFQQVLTDESKEEPDNLFIEVRHRHNTPNSRAGELVGYLEDI